MTPQGWFVPLQIVKVGSTPWVADKFSNQNVLTSNHTIKYEIGDSSIFINFGTDILEIKSFYMNNFKMN